MEHQKKLVGNFVKRSLDTLTQWDPKKPTEALNNDLVHLLVAALVNKQDNIGWIPCSTSGEVSIFSKKGLTDLLQKRVTTSLNDFQIGLVLMSFQVKTTTPSHWILLCFGQKPLEGSIFYLTLGLYCFVADPVAK